MGAINDALRALTRWTVLWLGLWLAALHGVRKRRFLAWQRRLRRRHGIAAGDPILPFGPELEASIAAYAAARRGVRYAETSGSTAKPKRIAYTPARVFMVKLLFMDAFARACFAARVRRTSVYVFSALEQDGSLTGMMLEERRGVPYLSGLQAPYRVQSSAPVRALIAEYGPAAVRLWVLLLANVGAWYATNPSTLSTFLDRLSSDYLRVSALARAFAREPGRFPPAIRHLARRITSRGARRRLALVADAERCPPLSELFPALELYMCWTGGYVRPFLERVERALPGARRVPMYSMSTETVETIGDYTRDETRFFPLAPGVLYEFVPEGAEDRVEHLVGPEALEIGRLYAMVVSDPYGLRRYQTGDLFEVVGREGPLPDLRFARRRALEYSFTGEKLTADQLSVVYDRLRPALGEGVFLSTVPSQPAGASVPHYKLVVIGADAVPADLGARYDAALSEENGEYAHKRRTERLGPPEVVETTLPALTERLAGVGWESQFKLLPLFRRLWEG